MKREIKHSETEHNMFFLKNATHANELPIIHRFGVLITILLFLFVSAPNAQNLDVPYVPTPNDVLERMLDLADVGPGDYVIDLGSGDGRIVIAAAKRGAVGHGVDIDPERISEARDNAETEGVSDRIMFLQEDIFETDFTQASVVTLYLLTSVNLELRPFLLENLRPGTRVVSHSFSMGGWNADDSVEIANRDLYFWIIPADLNGNWNWEANGENFSINIEQEFQKINTSVTNSQSLITEEATLKGERVNLIIHDTEENIRYIYSGIVEGHSINGTLQVHSEDSQYIHEWSAVRSNE